MICGRAVLCWASDFREKRKMIMDARQTVILQDMDRIVQESRIPWEKLTQKNVFVTGSTGLIGSAVVRALLHRNQKFGDRISVMALARNREKAEALFPGDPAGLTLLMGSIEDLPLISEPVDYIIHCACPTDSSFFLHQPVDTIVTILNGTRNILDLAREKQTAGVIFLSSMEVYGKIEEEILLSEDNLGEIDLMSPRSCYPMAKRMAENMCCSYWAQYGVPVAVCRLAQTFGPGVNVDDKRVFAYMARCVLDGRDIELATSGSKKNMYLYTADAVTAILTILLLGQPATTYNAANPNTYCSVKEMAQTVADTFGKGKVQVKTNCHADQLAKYPPDTFLYLNTKKLHDLGWTPAVNLIEMYKRMMSAY